MPINNFNDDLSYSLDDNLLFDDLYRKLFPNVKKVKFANDFKTQKSGIDKVLIFPNGNHVYIEEKKRRVDYGDILLEIWSDWEKRKRGWLYTSQSDYIFYAIIPTAQVYILPTLILKLAWVSNQSIWELNYKLIDAKNTNYTTKSIPIPPDVLFKAITIEYEQKFGST